MKKALIIPITLFILFIAKTTLASDVQVNSLSEGACWFEFKDLIKVASFNDKSVYQGTREELEAESLNLLNLGANQKISDINLALHCGGYGASVVAKIVTDSNSFCVWAKFDNGKLSLRSAGPISENHKTSSLCDGHKSGEFIIGINDQALLVELTGVKWSSIIKEISKVSDRVYKVKLVKEYDNREAEAASMIEEGFVGKNLIRYIEFNEYRHPIGEFISIK